MGRLRQGVACVANECKDDVDTIGQCVKALRLGEAHAQQRGGGCQHGGCAVKQAAPQAHELAAGIKVLRRLEGQGQQGL